MPTASEKKVPEDLVQGRLGFRSWGGARPGAGRKPKEKKAEVSHGRRALLASRHPVHVTARLRRGLPSLRRRKAYMVLRAALAAACDRRGFRLVHYSVQANHLHLIAEAKDRRTLSRGLQGLFVRIARRLNRLWERRGTVFADRYHDRVLKTPREVRNVLAYVLNNDRRHSPLAQARGECPIDIFASGWWFDGWKEKPRVKAVTSLAKPTAVPRTWLLGVGWRRHGLIVVSEVPGGAPRRQRFRLQAA